MDPTVLPMWMNSRERRTAIKLRLIPPRSVVRAFQRSTGDYMTVNLDGVDETDGVAILSRAGVGKANIPLEYIAAVWLEPRDTVWSLKIDGTIFRRPEFAFEPQGQ